MNDHIDGDFPTGAACPHHCYPTCHPAQVGPERLYGCTHSAWPQNKARDFCPIVGCGGDPNKCEIPTRNLQRARTGLKQRIRNLEQKIYATKEKLDALNLLTQQREERQPEAKP
jgi:hypothetical protein